MVNLETAITNGGAQASKEFSFRAPPQALQVIKSAGIDAVSMANNHGMDYGATGLADELAASRQYGLPVIGGGVDQTSAFQGYQRTIRGVRVAVVSATDVLDSSLQAAWTAGPDKPGLASAKDGDLFAQRIRQVSATADVVVAFLHWGVEKQVCPDRPPAAARRRAGRGRRRRRGRLARARAAAARPHRRRARSPTAWATSSSTAPAARRSAPACSRST